MAMHLLHQLLMKSAREYPERAAVTFKGKAITYSELDAKSSQLSLMLAAMGVKEGDRIGIMLGKSIEAIISLFGILKAGAIYVPVDPNTPADRAVHIIDKCGIRILVTTPDNLRKVCSVTGAAPCLTKAVLTGAASQDEVNSAGGVECRAWDALSLEHPGKYAPREMSDANPAYILHTSGSTGNPKGVVISHLNAMTFVNMAADYFRMQADDRVANHAPLHFDLSVFDIFGAVKSGATIFPVPEFFTTFPDRLAEFIDRENISVWNSVSSVLTMLSDRGKLERFRFDSLRLVHFSGDIMPVKYLRALKKHMKNAEFYNIYGQTEANSSLFYRVGTLPEDAAWKIPIGKPFPNFDVFAVDGENRIITEAGEEGELYVHGSTVAMGYWQDEARTNDRFVPDPRKGFCPSKAYRTGDMVRLDTEGNFVFAGRKDHMIKSRGYRIELDEIELALNSHPSIKQAVVVAVPDELIGNRLIAYIWPAEGMNMDDGELVGHCGKSLPKYMIPETIRIADSLPKTSTGKIDRNLLRTQAMGEWNVQQS